MRKFVLSGVFALGLLAIAATVLGHPASFNQANGSGADVRATTRHALVAMIDANHAKPLLVAVNLFQPADTGSG